MNKNVYAYLKAYSTNTVEIDRLITSAFLYSNNLEHADNNNLSKYIIAPIEKSEFLSLLTFLSLISDENAKTNISIEDLIELFEFVVSPADKIINGAVFTPSTIREHIVGEVLQRTENADYGKFADLSCGCGGFLLSVANALRKKTNRTYYEIYQENIYGVDIAQYSIDRSVIILTLNALVQGEVKKKFNFNLKKANSLAGRSKDLFRDVSTQGGFDCVLGNPPYVCSRNIDRKSLKLLKNWSVASSGHPDLYIPFFQIGIESLRPNGTLAYITVNTFFKSINGRALRRYFSDNSFPLTIINFGGEQVFNARNTYTCICFIKKSDKGEVKYAIGKSTSLEVKPLFRSHAYKDLDDHDGWNLVTSKSTSELVKKVENIGTKFKDKFVTRNGIATLKNDIYKFRPLEEDNKYYYFLSNEVDYKIEKNICRDIVNSNKLVDEIDIIRLKEKIIFPYNRSNGVTKIIAEKELKQQYKNAYSYLLAHKQILLTRDKGKKNYEAWYAFGRRQSMDINSFKLFFPHICERPRFVLCEDKDLLFYNGIAILSENIEELKLLKKVLESELFFNYLKNTTKNYSSGYISLSKNYIKNFGIYEFTDDERDQLLQLDRLAVDRYIMSLYGLDA